MIVFLYVHWVGKQARILEMRNLSIVVVVMLMNAQWINTKHIIKTKQLEFFLYLGVWTSLYVS